MKKSKKTALTVAAILLILGAAVSTAALAAVHFDFRRLSTDGYIYWEREPEGEFTKIQVDGSACDVKILADMKMTEEHLCRVEYSGSSNTGARAYVLGGTLFITGGDSGQAEKSEDWMNFVGIHTSEPEFTVHVAPCRYETIEVRLTSGNTELHDLYADEIAVFAKSGNVLFDETTASDQLSVEVTSGNVSLKNSDAGDIRVVAESGNVEGNLLTGKMFQVTSVSGNINVPEDCGNDFCRVKVTSGNVRLRIGKE